MSVAICLVVGLAYALVPWTIFPICEIASSESSGASVVESTGEARGHLGDAMPSMESSGHDQTSHMVCWHMAKAEAGVGILALLAAVALMATRSAERRAGILTMTAGLAVVGGLLPTTLIGVCPGPDMPCRVGTLPALLLVSAFFFVFSLIGAIRAARQSVTRRNA
jgi:hypothetical protein